VRAAALPEAGAVRAARRRDIPTRGCRRGVCGPIARRVRRHLR
jgi:hypothetical protein